MGDFDGITLIKKGKYRIQTITYFVLDNKRVKSVLDNLKEGLALEKAIDEEHNTYYVIAYIRYNEDREQVELEDVEFRMLDIEKQDWNYVKDMIRSAKDIVATQNLDSIGHY